MPDPGDTTNLTLEAAILEILLTLAKNAVVWANGQGAHQS
jgi:hypothetical protein